MKILFKQCPECLMVMNHQNSNCPNCNFNIANIIPSSLETEIQNKTPQVVAFTILSTLLLISMMVAAFYLGSKNTPQITAQVNVTPSPTASALQSASPTPSATTDNTNIPTNIEKPKPSPTNTELKEKKRNEKDGSDYGWNYVTQSGDSSSGYYYYYKPDSVQKANTGVEVWTRKYPMYPKGFAKKNQLSLSVDYVLEKLRFYCDRKEFYVLDESFFDNTGSSITNKNKGYRAVEQIPPNTTIETMENTVCLEN